CAARHAGHGRDAEFLGTSGAVVVAGGVATALLVDHAGILVDPEVDQQGVVGTAIGHDGLDGHAVLDGCPLGRLNRGVDGPVRQGVIAGLAQRVQCAVCRAVFRDENAAGVNLVQRVVAFAVHELHVGQRAAAGDRVFVVGVTATAGGEGKGQQGGQGQASQASVHEGGVPLSVGHGIMTNVVPASYRACPPVGRKLLHCAHERSGSQPSGTGTVG